MAQDPLFNNGDSTTEMNPLVPFHSYLHGAKSTILSTLTTIVTFPLYKTVFCQQLHNKTINEAVNQLTGEGLRKLYRGVVPPLLVRTLQGTLLFGVQDTLYRHFSHLAVGNLPTPLVQAAAGVGTGVVETLFFTPFERVQNVLQNGRNNQLTRRSILVRLSSVPSAHGFYRALLPIIARNALGSGVYFGLKNPVRDALDQQGLSPTAASFASGSVNSLVISLPLYPLSVLVANMQAGVGQEDNAKSGLRASARKLWAERQWSVALLYRGGSLVILRSCISWGITMAIYDRLQRGSSG